MTYITGENVLESTLQNKYATVLEHQTLKFNFCLVQILKKNNSKDAGHARLKFQSPLVRGHMKNRVPSFWYVIVIF